MTHNSSLLPLNQQGIAYIKFLIFGILLLVIFWELQQSFKQIAGITDDQYGNPKSTDVRQCIGSDPRDCNDLYEGTDLSAKNPN